jgi:hypothetical protein
MASLSPLLASTFTSTRRLMSLPSASVFDAAGCDAHNQQVHRGLADRQLALFAVWRRSYVRGISSSEPIGGSPVTQLP